MVDNDYGPYPEVDADTRAKWHFYYELRPYMTYDDATEMWYEDKEWVVILTLPKNVCKKSLWKFWTW